ncbi:AraC family transcriptional regulator [Vibrio brasiliensis]|uniref:AraC family transcriptional regulator n=1 Tax=Vibrio brasiliensis LMG 20546 TaxID=945543 RepID=E8LWK8_9VIBR|nr:AraC family transcriptional regulator [Vibrio brasiliensis]EGA64759.1 AraC family transcriptional regulator [Vibrio brasiliensis LMG 20546]MCG9651063.1 AraC family transcriptional regulator [Vibrio brasiliensis]MCG9725023.1 AraC family transcriptional regulator [Vibrio brasiliensis]
MSQENHFTYTSSLQQDEVSMLCAIMSDFSYSKHAHEEYSIGLTMQGRQDFFCRNAFYKSQPGCVMLFNPEDIHDGHSGGEQNLEYVMLYIHPNELKPLFQALGHKKDTILRLEDTLFDDVILRHQVYDMSQRLQGKSYSKIEHDASLFQLAQSLTRLHGSLELPRYRTRADKLLLRAKEYIMANLANDISIDDIAQAASMSKFHFIRTFREHFCITPHQYVLNCRINVARRQLLEGHSATRAALGSGFADASHLNRNFKRVFGMTPKQFQVQTVR